MHKAFFLFLLLPFWGFADLEDDVYGSEEIHEVTKEAPFSVKIVGDYIGKSHVTRVNTTSSTKALLGLDTEEQISDFKRNIEHSEIDFGIGGPQLTAVFAYNPDCCEGAYAMLGYNWIYLGWGENPLFRETHYQIVNAGFGVFTKRWRDWFWIVQASINIDAERPSLWHYSTYDITFWGRRAWSQNFGYNVGVLIQTGMKMDRFYPIIGIDWEFNEHWKLNLIFPINFSIIYTWNKNWAFSIASRFFNVRSRAGPGGVISRGTWRYENTGVEGMIAYTLPRWGLEANVHAGLATGAHVRIADFDNQNPSHFRTNPAPYGGAEVTLKF